MAGLGFVSKTGTHHFKKVPKLPYISKRLVLIALYLQLEPPFKLQHLGHFHQNVPPVRRLHLSTRAEGQRVLVGAAVCDRLHQEVVSCRWPAG